MTLSLYSRAMLAAALAVSLSPAVASRSWAAATPATPASHIDPKATALLNGMLAAYKNLSGLSVTVQTASQGGIDPFGPPSQLAIDMTKPNHASAHYVSKDADVHAVCDGTYIYIPDATDKLNYVKMPIAPDGMSPLIQTAIGATHGRLGPSVAFLAGINILPPPPLLRSLAVGPPSQVDGTAVDSVEGAVGQAGKPVDQVTLLIGKSDHLLRRMIIHLGGPGVTHTETHSNIKVNPHFSDASFTFTPPTGSKEVAPPTDPPMYDPALKPGATPFPIHADDLNGKPVSLDQYQGKVVMLDFWATWCGPCVGEIPNVVAAYDKYHSQGFDIVGISLDNAGDRDKLIAFTKTHGMAWRQVYAGKGWQSDIPVQYKVQAIPFTVLVGKDGAIAAVNVRGTSLAPAIEAALKK